MHRAIQFLARLTALAGGAVLLCLVVLTTLSIIGRSISKLLHSGLFDGALAGLAQWLLNLGIGEISGSYELLEAGVAFAIFSFLPICQFYGGHATVDIFTSFLGPRANRWIAALWEAVLTAVILLIIWRLYEGMMRYVGNGETTFYLQFPVWWAYAMSFAAGVVTCVVAVYCACARLAEAVLDRHILPGGQREH